MFHTYISGGFFASVGRRNVWFLAPVLTTKYRHIVLLPFWVLCQHRDGCREELARTGTVQF